MGQIPVDEVARLQPKRELSFYLVLLATVVPCYSFIIGSWAYVVWVLYTGHIWGLSWLECGVFVVALAEVFFSVYHFNLKNFVSGPSPNGPGNYTELQAAFIRVLQSGLAELPEDGFDEETLDVDRPGSPEETIETLQKDDPRAVDFRSWLRTWFKNVPWSSIHRHEMSLWIHWSIFNSNMPPPDSMPATHRAVIDDAIEAIEKRSGCKLPLGSNPAAQPILLTLDPVNICFRPFVWYAFVAIVNFLSKRSMRRQPGVAFGTHNGLDYLIRIPPSWDPQTSKTRPLLFLHGLGLGFAQYHFLMNDLMEKLPDTPILAPVQPHISQNIFHKRYIFPMGRVETVKCLTGIMQEVGWVGKEDEDGAIPAPAPGGVTVLSHSNGTYTHAWLLKAVPQVISRSCFVDPVTFCGFEGDVCYNFLYKPCSKAMDLLMFYFVGSELGVANLLQRHFDWSSNSLWYDEVPNARDPSKTLFVLGGDDAIVNSGRVSKYLRSHGVRKGLLYTAEHHHGEGLLPNTGIYEEIMDWLRAE